MSHNYAGKPCRSSGKNGALELALDHHSDPRMGTYFIPVATPPTELLKRRLSTSFVRAATHWGARQVPAGGNFQAETDLEESGGAGALPLA